MATQTYPSVAEIRARVEAGKQAARSRLRAEFGTDDASVIFGAIRSAIPSSNSPADAMNKARRALRREG